jgi:hypothetical protein
MLCNVAVHVERHMLRVKCCLVETGLYGNQIEMKINIKSSSLSAN